ncbi:MAG TPA: ORF6N domain-containing protein [Patescibacteria group bacterium]
MFELTTEETQILRSQFATSKSGRGGRRYSPHVFTERGAVMLASVLNSPIAISASIQVVRAFIQLRSMTLMHKQLAKKIDILEQKYDKQFKIVFDTIRKLMPFPSRSSRKEIDFR